MTVRMSFGWVCGHAAGPGGWRLWPKAGYWVKDESATSVQECAFPATSRCLGWNTADGIVTCGEGYDPSSPWCSECLPGYWPDASGAVTSD